MVNWSRNRDALGVVGDMVLCLLLPQVLHVLHLRLQCGSVGSRNICRLATGILVLLVLSSVPTGLPAGSSGGRSRNAINDRTATAFTGRVDWGRDGNAISIVSDMVLGLLFTQLVHEQGLCSGHVCIFTANLGRPPAGRSSGPSRRGPAATRSDRRGSRPSRCGP